MLAVGDNVYSFGSVGERLYKVGKFGGGGNLFGSDSAYHLGKKLTLLLPFLVGEIGGIGDGAEEVFVDKAGDILLIIL